jgi:integrase
VTVFQRKRSDRGDRADAVYSYDFELFGERHRGSTGQITEQAAEEFERRLKEDLRNKRKGLPAAHGLLETPYFTDWADEFYKIMVRRVKRPERVDFLNRSVLKFWGARPDTGSEIPIDPTAPYHNLRLGDVIREPYWLERFEQWMRTRGISKQTRNHYRSCISMMFKIASKPTHRSKTNVWMNPATGLDREKTRSRRVTTTPDQVRRWMAAAAPHVRLAITIGQLAPKLRVGNILALQWRKHIDLHARTITVWDHKTVEDTGEPLIVPISAQLLRVLKEERQRHPHREFVVMYQGKQIKSIRGGVTEALIRAKLPHGRDREGGITFHTLRHNATTEMLRKKTPLVDARDAMGHTDIQTTLGYTHLAVEGQRLQAELLSKSFVLEDLTHPSTKRRVGKRAGTSAKTDKGRRGKKSTKRDGGKPSKRRKPQQKSA